MGTPEAMASPAASPAATSAADAVYQYVKAEYAAQFNFVWLDQSQMNDLEVSPDGMLLATLADYDGSERFELRIQLDLVSIAFE